jgi:Calcium binding
MAKPRVPRRSLSRSPRRRQARREARIIEDITVDAYGAEERAMGWYYYLDGRLRFPFQAKCVRRAATSPLRVGEIVTIAKMAPENDCGSDMVVLTRLSGRSFGVPLSQLQPCDVDTATAEAIADWHYWWTMGYQF